MAMLFYLTSMWCFLGMNRKAEPAKHAQVPLQEMSRIRGHFVPRGWYWLSLLSFLLALLSKGSVAPLPLVLLGLMVWRRRLTFRDLALTAPFFLVAAALTFVNVWFQRHNAGEVIRQAGFLERLLGAGAAVWFFLSLALWPVILFFVYPLWRVDPGVLFWWLPLLAAVGVTGGLGWRARLRAAGRGAAPGQISDRRVARSEIWWRGAWFAWGYFCVMLVPVLGFTDVYFMKYSLVADHYQHLALIGVVAFAGAAGEYVRSRTDGANRIAMGLIGTAAVCGLAGLTWRQCQMYRNSTTLYETILSRNPGCWLAHVNLGDTLYAQGKVAEATPHYEAALAINPNNADAHFDLGTVLIREGRYSEAALEYQAALRLNPRDSKTLNFLGLALAHTDQLSAATASYAEALRLDPNNASAHNNFGIALARAGRASEAILHFEQAVRIDPANSDARNNLEFARQQAGPNR